MRQQAKRLTTKLNNFQEMLSKEVQSLKSKITTASTATDTIHHYVVNRKRSLWLWVEDRALLSKLGHIFRGHMRKSRSASDLTATQLQYSSNQRKTSADTMYPTNARQTDPTNNSIHRYYHVFQKGELLQLIDDNVTMLQVQTESFTQGNWVLAAQKL